MDSPATGAQRSRPRSHRKPLQPRNAPTVLHSLAHPKPIKPDPVQLLISPTHENAADKENWFPAAAAVEFGPTDTSLAVELGAVRRRRERLRLDRERTEAALVEMERQLNRAMREVERRWEEQRWAELELRRLIGLRGIWRPCERSSPFKSLREREQERSNKDARFDVSPAAQELRTGKTLGCGKMHNGLYYLEDGEPGLKPPLERSASSADGVASEIVLHHHR